MGFLVSCGVGLVAFVLGLNAAGCVAFAPDVCSSEVVLHKSLANL